MTNEEKALHELVRLTSQLAHARLYLDKMIESGSATEFGNAALASKLIGETSKEMTTFFAHLIKRRTK